MPETLPGGAHLTTRRRGYQHHGIYAGGGRVIHYAGFNRYLRAGVVEEVSLNQFTRGSSFEIRSVVAPKFAGTACVERARSRLGEDNYRLLSNNCEHFAEWCLSGTSRSRQVEPWRERLRKGVRGPVALPRGSRPAGGPLAASSAGRSLFQSKCAARVPTWRRNAPEQQFASAVSARNFPNPMPGGLKTHPTTEERP